MPAYFNDAQRQATKDAGLIAGLEVLRVLSEPTAAAIAYGCDSLSEETRNVLVYDLGGGTFDVSIVQCKGTAFKVLAVAGDTHLGGEDFDNQIVKYCLDEFKEETDIDASNDQRVLRRLRGHCEKAKCLLSQANEAEISADALADGEDLNVTLTRQKFEDLCMPLFEKTIESVQSALNDADLSKNDIHEIVMVGGSSRIPKI